MQDLETEKGMEKRQKDALNKHVKIMRISKKNQEKKKVNWLKKLK